MLPFIVLRNNIIAVVYFFKAKHFSRASYDFSRMKKHGSIIIIRPKEFLDIEIQSTPIRYVILT